MRLDLLSLGSCGVVDVIVMGHLWGDVIVWSSQLRSMSLTSFDIRVIGVNEEQRNTKLSLKRFCVVIVLRRRPHGEGSG